MGLDLRLALTERSARVRTALVLRAAGIHTSFFDALFIRDRQAVFSAVGFEGAFE